MSKLLTPKIHASSSSTKILRITYTLLNQNTHTIPTSATPHAPLSPGYSHYTNPALRTTSTTPSSTRIHHPFLNHNTHTHHIDDHTHRDLKKITIPKIFLVTLDLSAQGAPASDPLRQSALVLVPPGAGNIPCQGAMGTTTMWAPHR
mgnify:CR=1 FL=1